LLKETTGAFDAARIHDLHFTSQDADDCGCCDADDCGCCNADDDEVH